MPEGDVVKRSCAALHAALAGQRLTRAELRVPAYATVPLVGATVLEVVARGKHQLTRFDNGLTLHTHLRMEGGWRIVRTGRTPRDPAYQIRAILGNPTQTAFGMRLGITELVETSQEDRVVGHLGPDLLAEEFDAEEALRRLRSAPGATIGEALLDQRNLAGIGTFYRAEILFLQGIHPRTPVADVAGLPRLVARVRHLLQANVTRPYQVTTGNTRPGERAWVFDRTGRACRRCGTAIEEDQFGPVGKERFSYWCPSCQPDRR